jgi:hypothetical protein
MASESFEQRMERACRNKEIPGAILAGGDREGKSCVFLSRTSHQIWVSSSSVKEDALLTNTREIPL